MMSLKYHLLHETFEIFKEKNNVHGFRFHTSHYLTREHGKKSGKTCLKQSKF